MNAEEQTVTWLISLGVLSSPKKTVADAEGFLKAALRDGVVLCRLMERLQPGCVHKYCAEPRSEAECLSNIREFLKGCAALKVEGFDPESVYTGENFGKVVSTLLAINFATQGKTRLRFLTLPVCPATSLLCISDIFCLMCLMSENGSGQLLVKARFNFKQNNEDELSFTKGELISVTRQEEGGWWEGTLNGKTGWFPSNYVREVKPSDSLVSPSEPGSVTETTSFLFWLTSDPCLLSPRLSSTDGGHLVGNLEDILTFQQGLCVALEECAKMPEGQQRLGGCYLNLLCQIRMLYLSYCSTHPSAVCVLTEHGEGLEAFMESQGASGHGVLSLTTGLSKPFLRLEKYPTLLQELERHVEEAHPDYSDIAKATAAFKNLVTQCNEVRKRKALELQILSEPLRGWEGESVRSLGHVIHTSHVHLQMGAGQDKEERYLMLFPNVLLMLSASPRMSGFIYQGRLPLSGATVAKQVEDADGGQFAFEITGPFPRSLTLTFCFSFERLTVFCSSQQDLQEWLDHLHALTKGGSPVGTLCINNVCDSLKGADGKPGGAAGPPGHQGYGAPMGNRGPLEPPKINKPWSLSCLRPAPPLKPSAALGYKEDTSKSPRPIKKFLPKRKTERKHSDDEVLLRKSTAALEEDAQILKVIEAYCTGASMHQATTAARKESVPQVLLPEEEKIIVEEVKSNGQTVIEEKSLVDAVYALKDEVLELKKESKRMKQCLEEEQRSRKELERIVRRLAKQKNDCVWDDSGH
uniref:Rac/Cdc42 guanine nucleotide exchange factor 6 n=1 Tax=Scleropages formosus TaxID=113540 RepID=A0A8C9VBV0_SCLFO